LKRILEWVKKKEPKPNKVRDAFVIFNCQYC
jgi:hypothetical protein